MQNLTLFDGHNDLLLLIYNICSPVCILLNALAVYLIICKSNSEMKTYRWHLLNYQIWASIIDIFLNFFYKPVMFFPLMAATGYGILVTNFEISALTCFYILANLQCGLNVSIMQLFFYRHQCIVSRRLTKKQFFLCIILQFFVLSFSLNNFLKLSYVDLSKWGEMLEQWNPKAIELLQIPHLFYIPHSSRAGISLSIFLVGTTFSASFTTGLVCHIFYVLHKDSEHLSIHTRKKQRKFLISLILQVTIPLVFMLNPFIFMCIRILDGRLGLQILNNMAMMMVASYGIFATLFLIYFNYPYREFVLKKFKELTL